MMRPDMGLFLAMTAGPAPTPWLLAIACFLARNGPWLSAGLMGWAAIRQPRQRAYLLALLTAAAVAAPVAHALAQLLAFPRPFMLGVTPAYLPHGGSEGLPSTHATVMGLVALGLLARPALRRLGLAAAGAALATGWARIHVGVHFPLDVVGGFLLAALLLAAFLAALRHLRAARESALPAGAEPSRAAAAIAALHRQEPLS